MPSRENFYPQKFLPLTNHQPYNPYWKVPLWECADLVNVIKCLFGIHTETVQSDQKFSKETDTFSNTTRLKLFGEF